MVHVIHFDSSARVGSGECGGVIGSDAADPGCKHAGNVTDYHANSLRAIGINAGLAGGQEDRQNRTAVLACS